MANETVRTHDIARKETNRSRTAPRKQWTLAGRKDVKITTEGALKQHTAQKCRFRKNDVEGLPKTEANPLQLLMDSSEGSTVALGHRLAFVNGVLDVCSQISR